MSESATPTPSVDPQEKARGIAALVTRYRSVVTAALTLLLFTLVGIAIYKLTDEVSYDDVVTHLLATPPLYIGYAVFFTALSFATLTLYDRNALDYIRHPLPMTQVALTSFTSYAVGNAAGFGALSGGAIRYRAYSRQGLAPEEIGRVIAFVTLSFMLGVTVIAALSVLAIAEEASSLIGVSSFVLRMGATAILAVTAVMILLGQRKTPVTIGPIKIRFADTRTLSRQFLVTLADIAASASVLYVLLPESDISWPAFAAIFSIALGLALVSHVPAGIGVFEAIVIAALHKSASIDAVLGSLVLYRLIYYVLPLVVAVVALTVVELRRLAGTPLSQDVNRALNRLSPTLIAAFALVLGVMLIFSSVTPTPDTNLEFLSAWVPLPVLEGAHFISSILGLALVITARGLSQRLDGAWWAALVTTVGGLIMSLLKAAALFEAALLAVMVVTLLSSHRLFKRPASLLRQALTPAWIVAICVICVGALVVLFFVYRDVEYSRQLWWQFEFAEEAPRSLRAALAITLATTAIAIFSLLRPAVGTPAPPSAEDLEAAVAIAAAQHDADANLVRTGDKSLMFSPARDAFIMYGRQGRSLIAFLDPIGPPESHSEMVWQFVETARATGCRAVFYQASPALLPAIADAGLQAYKLGELAIVDISTFDLKGGRWANLRQTAARAERDGLTFEIVEVKDLPPILPALKAVSDDWLAQHRVKEKGFSLGAFTEDYMLSQPVAVLKLGEEIVAFANILITDAGIEASIDLMRFSSHAPKGSMDYLFVGLMREMNARGMKHFNLGMAPLSGLSRREVAPVWDRIANTFYEHSEGFYNFKGLRAFKNKFHPRWQPRYLAVSGGLNPLLALLDATLLIGGGLKGVVRK